MTISTYITLTNSAMIGTCRQDDPGGSGVLHDLFVPSGKSQAQSGHCFVSMLPQRLETAPYYNEQDVTTKKYNRKETEQL